MRSVTDIRADIEETVAQRAAVYRAQAHASVGVAPELAETRAGLDARLRYLWDELREARIPPFHARRTLHIGARA